MAKLRVAHFSMSVDGFGAGPNQTLDDPLGAGGERLHDWVFETAAGREMIGETGGETGFDNDVFLAGRKNFGATIMGRNMFGPVRGDWPNEDWKGWWGDNPPYHHDTFVLTHHPRASIPMEGGTTFHFVTDGIESALRRAFESADGKDVHLAGGVSVIQQYMRAGLLDELHIAVVPVLLRGGERLLEHTEGYEVAERIPSPRVTHVRLVKSVKSA